MSLRSDFQRSLAGLSAQERALLVLRSWKAKEEEDPHWRETMPRHQAKEFNRFIDLMNAANMQVAP